MYASLPKAHEYCVTSLQFYSATQLLSTSGDDTAALWDTRLMDASGHNNNNNSNTNNTSVESRSRTHHLRHHTEPVNCALLFKSSADIEDSNNESSYNPHEHYVLTGSDDKTIALWDLRNTSSIVSEIKDFGGGINKMIFLDNRNNNSGGGGNIGTMGCLPPVDGSAAFDHVLRDYILASACDDGQIYIHALMPPTAAEAEAFLRSQGTASASNIRRYLNTSVYMENFFASTYPVNDLVAPPALPRGNTAARINNNSNNVLITAAEDNAIRVWNLYYDRHPFFVRNGNTSSNNNQMNSNGGENVIAGGFGQSRQQQQQQRTSDGVINDIDAEDRMILSFEEFENPVGELAFMPAGFLPGGEDDSSGSDTDDTDNRHGGGNDANGAGGNSYARRVHHPRGNSRNNSDDQEEDDEEAAAAGGATGVFTPRRVAMGTGALPSHASAEAGTAAAAAAGTVNSDDNNEYNDDIIDENDDEEEGEGAAHQHRRNTPNNNNSGGHSGARHAAGRFYRWLFASSAESAFAVDYYIDTHTVGQRSQVYSGHEDYVRGMHFITYTGYNTAPGGAVTSHAASGSAVPGEHRSRRRGEAGGDGGEEDTETDDDDDGKDNLRVLLTTSDDGSAVEWDFPGADIAAHRRRRRRRHRHRHHRSTDRDDEGRGHNGSERDDDDGNNSNSAQPPALQYGEMRRKVQLHDTMIMASAVNCTRIPYRRAGAVTSGASSSVVRPLLATGTEDGQIRLWHLPFPDQ